VTRIKFCGMTRAKDVDTALGLGVDALGFVLWPGSPRYVSLDRVTDIVRGLPSRVTPVGVFVRPSRDEVARALAVGLRVAQLHAVNPEFVETLDCEVWIAARLVEDGIAPEVPSIHTVLLDTHDPDRHGGTGRTIDWARAARIAAARRVMLAGGLTPENVRTAIAEAKPYGVDVASGIEDTPGVKSARAMREFVAAVREAHS
jgi:phosphoribosylanthranilate isomerase